MFDNGLQDKADVWEASVEECTQFPGVLAALRTTIGYAQNNVVMEKLFDDASKIIGRAQPVIDKVPDPVTDKASFLKFTKAKDTNAKIMTDQKKDISEIAKKIHGLGASWQLLKPGKWTTVLAELVQCACNLESVVFINALVKTVGLEAVTAPQGATLRATLLNIVSTIVQRKELVCPPELLTESLHILKEFSDSRTEAVKIEGMMGKIGVERGSDSAQSAGPASAPAEHADPVPPSMLSLFVAETTAPAGRPSTLQCRLR